MDHHLAVDLQLAGSPEMGGHHVALASQNFQDPQIFVIVNVVNTPGIIMLIAIAKTHDGDNQPALVESPGAGSAVAPLSRAGREKSGGPSRPARLSVSSAHARRLRSWARRARLASSRRSVTLRRTCSLGSLSSSQAWTVVTRASSAIGEGKSQRSAVPTVA